MKYADIKDNLTPFYELIETIPSKEQQGVKVARILLLKLEESYQQMAEMAERIAYLEGELFGKNKNKEDPEEEESKSCEDTASSSSNAEAKEKEQAAKEKLNKSKSTVKLVPKGTAKSQRVRRRVPAGLKCRFCHGEVKDQGLAHKASEIDLEPVKVIDRQYFLHRGTCSCGAVDFEMPRPDRALDKSNYSAEFIAHLIVSKFKFHLPVYRQQKQLADAGIFVHRSVLNELILRSWQQLQPLVKRMGTIAREQLYRYVDETPLCRVKGKKSLRNYLWCVHTDLAIVFELTDKRNQSLARKIVGRGGTLMTDGLCIYGAKTIDGSHGNCLSHCLQKFFRSFASFPHESDQAIDFLVKVYEIEREAKEKGLTPEQRLALRQEKSASIMATFGGYLEGLNPPPRSSLGKAIKYTLDQWEELTLFLSDGCLEVDNNRVESIFRDVKLGMKNFLFVQSDLGGAALAGFYSLIATCELHGINPVTYLADILLKLASGHPQKGIDELLPWNWIGEESPLRVRSTETFVEQDYPVNLLIKRLRLEDKVYFDKAEGRRHGRMGASPPPPQDIL